MNIKILLITFLTMVFPISGLLAGDYSTRVKIFDDASVRFNPEKLILPIYLVGFGAYGLNHEGEMGKLNNAVKNSMAEIRNGRYCKIDDYIQYLPTISVFGLEYAGIKAKHTFSERLAITATSWIAMGLISTSIKYTVREMRPDNSSANSFPSGHTATAFMGAELVRMEYGIIPGIIAYSMAGAVGYLRMYNERHWLGDVIAGAGIGILSANIGYLLLPLNRKIFNMRSPESVSISAHPCYFPEKNSMGYSLSLHF